MMMDTDIIDISDTDNEIFILNRGIIDIASTMPEPVHIKDVPNGRCIFTNENNLKAYGLTKTSQMIGKTICDLDVFMQQRWGKGFASQIDVLDKKVCATGETLIDRDRIFVSVDGVVRIQDMTKIPLYDKKRKVVAIFTFSHDKTKDVHLLSLLKIYGKVYASKVEISKYFCKYLNIDFLFTVLPTVAEITFLLYAKDYRLTSEVAQMMNRSVKTCETHVSHINNKLSEGDVREVINYLRVSMGSTLVIKDAKLCC